MQCIDGSKADDLVFVCRTNSTAGGSNRRGTARFFASRIQRDGELVGNLPRKTDLVPRRLAALSPALRLLVYTLPFDRQGRPG